MRAGFHTVSNRVISGFGAAHPDHAYLRVAAVMKLMRSTPLNEHDPQAYLKDTLTQPPLPVRHIRLRTDFGLGGCSDWSQHHFPLTCYNRIT